MSNRLVGGVGLAQCIGVRLDHGRGVLRGLISERASDAGYPQNVWSVTDDDIPLEAQLENPDLGVYHGYPMPEADPFRHEVLERWFAR